MADGWPAMSRLLPRSPNSHPDHLIPKFSFSISCRSLIPPPLSHGHPRSLRSRPKRLHISPPKATNFNWPLIPSDDDKHEPDVSLSPSAKFLRFLSEKLVICLLGSFIFVGFVQLKPSFALSSPASESSPQAGDAQEEGSDEEEMSERLLEMDPMNVDALKVVLYGKMRRGKTKEAVKYLQRLVDVEPDEVEWRLLLALCHETMGQLSTAKRLFREILKETPLLLRALHV